MNTVDDIKRKQIVSWIERCKENMEGFNNSIDSDKTTQQEKINFVRRQYYLIYLLNNFLLGKSKLEGIDLKKVKQTRWDNYYKEHPEERR
jgi:hypothetical protein